MAQGSTELALAPTRDAGRWSAAAHASGQRVTPFHDFAWLTVAAAMTGTEFTALVVTDGGRDVGVVPWLARRRGPLSTVNALPFPYAGPLVPAELLLPTLLALRRWARRQRAVRQEYGLAPTTVPAVLEALPGFHVRTDETYLIDVGVDREELLNGLSSAGRRSLRKAERDGITIIVGGNCNATLARAVDLAYSGRGASSGYSFEFLTVEGLESTGLAVHWTVAVSGGEELGSLLTVATDDLALLWLGGVLPEHRASRANVALYWDAICWAQDHGARTVDLVGVPDQGIGRFKSQFGGTLHPYARLQRTMPVVRAIQRVVR